MFSDTDAGIYTAANAPLPAAVPALQDKNQD
jgi:hypothetical protein